MAVEVKVGGATTTSFIASMALAIANAVVADSTILGGLPPVLQFIIIMTLPTVITFLGGYALPSRTSSVSDEFRGE